MLEKGETYMFPVDEHLGKYIGLKNFPKLLQGMHKAFNSVGDNKFFITETFNDALKKSQDKLVESMQTKMNLHSNIYDSCLIMHRLGFGMHQCEKLPDGTLYTRFYVFTKNTLIGHVNFDLSKYPEEVDFAYLSNNFGEDPKKAMLQLYHSYMLLLYFMVECEVETKIIKPKEKIRVDKDKYFNESKSPITLLDCRWFTELIINSPFGVSGHLRWQACGEGRTKRKLIWIDAFEKKGYHRKAKVETFNQ